MVTVPITVACKLRDAFSARNPLLAPEEGVEEGEVGKGKVNRRWGLGSSSITAMGTKNSGTRIKTRIIKEEQEEEEEEMLNETFLILPLLISSRK